MRPRGLVAQAPADNVNSKKTRQPPKKRVRVADVDGDDPQSVELVKTAAKKARWQPKPGKLAAIMNLPLDVLFEVRPFYLSWSFRHPNVFQIFGHLNPLDLLRLARTTKQFRRVLMHRSSISVWKTARDNVLNMPDCPVYWTEPYYANLAFDPHCHVCF
jgi:hypothetical protein